MSTQGSGRTVSTDGKVGFCTSNNFHEVEALLPSPCHQCYDKPTTQKGNEQVGSRRTTDPKNAIKAQVLTDFIAEFTPSYNGLDGMEDTKKWVIHIDGLSTQYAGGIGVVLQSPEGDKLKHKVRLQYQTTNNEVEYEVLLKGLELAKSLEAESILVLGDS